MGLKSGNVEKAQVLHAFVAGSRTAVGKSASKSGGLGWKKARLLIKNALCRSSELCFLHRQGAQFS